MSEAGDRGKLLRSFRSQNDFRYSCHTTTLSSTTNSQRCRCGSVNLDIQPCPDGPHFALARCRDCGRATWLKTPWSIERAMAFALPYGQHRGRTIGELAKSQEGRAYLRWLAGNVGGNPAIAAQIVLDHVVQTCSDVSQTSLHKNTPSAAENGPTGHADDALVFTPEGIVR